MQTQLVLTMIADDQTGLVGQVAKAVADANGNWLESSMSQLAGKFAGITLISLPKEKQSELESSLDAMKESGIHIYVETVLKPAHDEDTEMLILKVVANDRPGIIQELTRLLASLNVNVESLETCCDSAAMSSEPLFEASAVVVLPPNLDEDALAGHLESLSDDLMVEIYNLEDEDEEV